MIMRCFKFLGERGAEWDEAAKRHFGGDDGEKLDIEQEGVDPFGEEVDVQAALGFAERDVDLMSTREPRLRVIAQERPTTAARVRGLSLAPDPRRKKSPGPQ